MRLMILRAALFAAEADFGAATAPADPESVQASADDQGDPVPQTDSGSQVDPPADPSSSDSSSEPSVADGLRSVGAFLSDEGAPGVEHVNRAIGALEAGGHAPDVSPVPSDPSLVRDTRPAPMGAPVIVRQDGKLAPGVVVEEDDGEGSGITVQIFRGDHLPHAARHLSHTTAKDTSDGWFFPWERGSL